MSYIDDAERKRRQGLGPRAMAPSIAQTRSRVYAREERNRLEAERRAARRRIHDPRYVTRDGPRGREIVPRAEEAAKKVPSLWLEVGRAATASIHDRDPELIAAVCQCVEAISPSLRRIVFHVTDGSGATFTMARDPSSKTWRQAATKGA